ncbi:MAG: hypothetical protein K8T10_19835 [Candidatus Eremiobacteraeota bacterium]|nr:hypothetical protein [Candidatus Eremiobacteraeota bacterium]
MKESEKIVFDVIEKSDVPLKSREIIARSGLDDRLVYGIIYKLKSSGDIHTVKRGQYVVGMKEIDPEEEVTLQKGVWIKLKDTPIKLKVENVKSKWVGNIDIGFVYRATIVVTSNGSGQKNFDISWNDKTTEEKEVCFENYSIIFNKFYNEKVGMKISLKSG